MRWLLWLLLFLAVVDGESIDGGGGGVLELRDAMDRWTETREGFDPGEQREEGEGKEGGGQWGKPGSRDMRFGLTSEGEGRGADDGGGWKRGGWCGGMCWRSGRGTHK